MSDPTYSASDSDVENNENVYCIFLHIVEGVALQPKDTAAEFYERRKEKIILNASLNGVKFEVEGHSTESATIFNSNCVWECELNDLKRMKTDNRPVKLECFLQSRSSGQSPRRLIGSLLLPLRGVQMMTALKDSHFKLHWHKFGALNSEWREKKPEIYLLLLIVKKPLFESGQLEAMLSMKSSGRLMNEALSPHVSETALMLQSQSNVYVQLLEQIGVIQVGNNSDIDCDIFHVSLTFKQLKNVSKLIELERNYSRQLMSSALIFQYDFLGSVSTLEIDLNASDCYGINEKISLSFKSSLKSLRAYFQRIFYIPINLYWNGIAIANYRFDFAKLLPSDAYFEAHKQWVKIDSFIFDRLHKILSPRAIKPFVDFAFTIQLSQSYAVKNKAQEIAPLHETLETQRYCERGAGDMLHCFHLASDSNCNDAQPIGVEYVVNHSSTGGLFDVAKKLSEGAHYGLSMSRQDVSQCNDTQIEATADVSLSVGVSTLLPKVEDKQIQAEVSCDTNARSIGINTEPQDAAPVQTHTEELSYQIVRELEAWKAQQIEHFLGELERKEAAHMVAVDEEWRQKRTTLQARLDSKLAQCEQLNNSLEVTYAALKAQRSQQHDDSAKIVEVVKCEIESSYAQRFEALDAEMERIKQEMQQQGTSFESQYKMLQSENAELRRDKRQLGEHIDQLERQLAQIKQTHISADQLKTVLADVRVQNERFAEIDQLRQYYKEEWSKATSELHKIQLNHIQCQKKCLNEQQRQATAKEHICLEEILNDEQDALKTDRGELKSIKDMLFLSTDDTAFSSIGDENNDEAQRTL